MRILAVCFLVASACSTSSAGASLPLGSVAPQPGVKMKSVDGRLLALNDVKGAKGTLVVFTCNHCPYVKAWEQRITLLGNSYQEKGVGVIAINSNDPARVEEDRFEAMQERAKKLSLAFPYVVDSGSKLARAFGATRTPEAFLFNAAGVLVYHGAVDDNSSEPAAVQQHFLKDALEAVATGRDVALSETKAIGCSIKFTS